MPKAPPQPLPSLRTAALLRPSPTPTPTPTTPTYGQSTSSPTPTSSAPNPMLNPSLAPNVSFRRPDSDAFPSGVGVRRVGSEASMRTTTIPLDAPVARMYQTEIFNEACTRNIIAVMDTGSGKTMIATMLLEHVCLKSRERGGSDKLAFFLVPSVPLVYQQAQTVRTTTTLTCKSFCGETAGVDLWNREKWIEQLEIDKTDVVVCTPQILLNCLGHGYLRMNQLSLVVIVHHCRKNHPYSVFFQNFYHTCPAGADRPKILGLTASPIWNVKQPQKSLEDLQTKTTCTVIAVKANTAELDAHAPKPNESIVYYSPANASPQSTFAQELMLLWGDLKVGKHDFEKIEVKATKAMDVLGPLGMDHYLVSQYAEPVAEALRLASITPGTDKARLSTLKYLKALIDDRRRTWPATIASSTDITSKVRALASVLAHHREKAAIDSGGGFPASGALIDLREPDEIFQCIVFVQERHIAFSLSWLLERMPELRSWLKVRTLVGHASTQKNTADSGQLSKNQRDTVRDFKDREFNVLISTSVGEEGLDFPACHLIVRFDVMPTIIAYLQSRGRARHQESQFVLLVNESNPVEMELFEKFSSMEPILKEYYKNSVPSVQEPTDVTNLSNHDAICRQEYIVSSTGARLTYESAVQLVGQTCNLIPKMEGVPPPQPIYTVYNCIEEGGIARFACDLTLPAATHIPLDRLKIRGTPRSTKAEAKRSVAWDACKLLHEFALLDDYLMPHREKRIETQVEAEIADSLPEIEQAIDVKVDATWGNIWSTQTAYLHPISVDGVVLLGLVSGKPLLPGKTFTLWQGMSGDEAAKIQVLPSLLIDRCPSHFDMAATLKKLDTWTRQIIHRIIRPQWQDPKIMASLFAPVRGSTEVDWNAIDHVFDVCGWDDFDKERDVMFDSYQRAHALERVRADLTPESRPILVDQEGGLKPDCREKDAPSYIAYARSDLLRGLTPVTVQDNTMLQARTLERRRNNIVARDVETTLEKLAVALERQKATPRVILMRQLCKFSKLPIALYRAALLLPSIVRCVNDHNRIAGMSAGLCLQDVEYNMMHTALTPPSAMYGHDYQALETLGDSVLKLCTTVHTYNVYPHKHEGFLSILRANAVSNKFLRGHANDAGLGSMMITEPVQVTRWDPPNFDAYTSDGVYEKRVLNRKWLQDCTEATLGACYLTGGFAKALQFGAKLDLMFGGTSTWASRYGGPRERVDLQIGRDFGGLQKTLGYTFNDPRLLLEAMTHPSTIGMDSAPYQRLEYLGDALLDFLVLRRVYKDNPHAAPGDLTHLKQSMVANAPLCFLSVKHLELHKYLIHNTQAVTQQIADAIVMFEDVTAADLLSLAWSFNPPKVTSDLVESCVGAIFIDCGWDVEKVNEVMMPLLEPLFANVKYAPRVDPVGELWRWAFKNYQCAKIVFSTAPRSTKRQHMFPTDVHIHGVLVGSAGDDVKKTAKNRAAYNAMKRLLEEDPGLMGRICDCAASAGAGAMEGVLLVDV